jgi:type IV pilus assembly protein PilC
MPTYFYTAKSFEGEMKSGTLEAKDEYQLARILKREGYILISADLEEKERKRKFEIPFFSKGVSLKEKLMFIRNLKVMLSAGISLPQALNSLAEQIKNRKFKETLLKIKEEIIKGKSFSETISKYPNIFPEFFVSMIRVGEIGGTLEESLEILIRQLEREYELKSKIKGAMIYPAVIVCAMILVGFLMLVMVVPKLSQTFEELKIELPPTTKLVIALGNFSKNYWYFLILIILVFLLLFRSFLRTKVGKKLFDKFSLKIPIFSPLVKKINSAYTVRTLGSLIASGVPIVEALKVTSRTLGNFYYKGALKEAAEKVKKGAKLSETLKPYQNIYSLLVIQMIRVGEETGQTSEILAKLAEFFEEEVTTATKNLTAIIEPLLLIVIGVVVGFFAISMIQPMYSMLGGL